MVQVNEAVVVKYDKSDAHFEILADPDLVLKAREGDDIDVSKALAVFEIYKNASKAEKASLSEVQRVFGTDDPIKVAHTIILKGIFHPTTAQKKVMMERIKQQIIGILMQNSTDPRTKLPHTRERIEWGLNEARVKIEFKSAREQIDTVLKAIRVVLPISFGTAKLQVIVPSNYAASVYGQIRHLGKVIKESWLSNGSLEVTLEVPAGLKVDVITTLGNLTKGEIMVKEEIK
ncbi:MAG: ribosome assembly factor SBDS [Candidatus Altiarchaeota archaeon]|nr:ribosome assembly factor SBDS [Candidatus Altiarchaeota archaeon]